MVLSSNASPPRRIAIIGGAGSGKTTLARLLAMRLDAPAYDLDAVAYESGAGRKVPLDDRLRAVYTCAAETTWVAEGGYLWWNEELLRTADVIVWLDLPWRVTAWRIVWRHVQADLTRSNRHPGLRRLSHFLRNTRAFFTDVTRRPPRTPDDDGAVTLAHMATALAPYATKVVRCRSPRDVKRLLARFS